MVDLCGFVMTMARSGLLLREFYPSVRHVSTSF